MSLIFLILAPLILSFFPLLLPKTAAKPFSFVASLIPLALLLLGVETSSRMPWLQVLSIDFHLNVDSLSLIFLYLTAIIIPLTIVATSLKSRTFFALTLFLEALLIGFFTSRNLVFFTIFWEAMLLPLFFMITMWGSPKRERAALQFILYMVAGSCLMVAAVLALYLASGTFDMDHLQNASPPFAPYIAFIFFLAFAVKTPLFPFHAWLPDAYTEASTSGTILLSSLLSKAGIYGFLRVGMEIFPNYLKQFSPYLLPLAIAGVLYGGLAAWRQTDFKRLIAYSSFSHVNFILAGVFAMTEVAYTGAALQAFNHGITIAALFLVAGWLEERLGTREITGGQGLAKYFPILCWVTLFFVLSSVALPGTNNFIGEILILFGLFKENPYLTALLTTSVILSVIYMLRWMQKMYFDAPTPHLKGPDISKKEIFIALPLILLVLWVGIYPAPLLTKLEYPMLKKEI